MLKVLLTGASGMLGNKLFEKLIAQNKYEIFTVGRDSFTVNDKHFISDISDAKQLTNVLQACNPEIVINCAAYVNLDYCEKNQLQADLLHNQAVALISSYKSVKAVYYVSTDSVFDGQRGDYFETDITNPLNYYATSKLNGEKAALKYAQKAFILRTNIFGFNSKLGNSLFEWAYRNISKGEKINGFSNVYFNPLYVSDLADMITIFIEKCANPGIYNLGSQPVISKYTFLYKIAQVFNYDTNLIGSVLLDNSLQKTLRPLNTTLNTTKIHNLGIQPPDIDFCIKHLHIDFLAHGNRI